jgi:hypothetical protein
MSFLRRACPRENGNRNPENNINENWIPAFAGMAKKQ